MCRSSIRFIPTRTSPNRYATISAGHPHIRLIEPLDYISFVDLMRRSYLLLTDSGGIQEEAPSLGKPVLVLREKTERPEAVEAGTATLVGTDVRKIVDATTALVQNASEYERRRADSQSLWRWHGKQPDSQVYSGFRRATERRAITAWSSGCGRRYRRRARRTCS